MDKSNPAGKLVWRSGDWRASPRPTPPYNGLQLELQVTRDEKGALKAINLTATDFTNSPKGSAQAAPLVPEPGVPTKFKPDPKKAFTVNGRVELRSFEKRPGDFVLYCDRVEYGLPDARHTVLGGVLAFPIVAPPAPKGKHDVPPAPKPKEDPAAPHAPKKGAPESPDEA